MKQVFKKRDILFCFFFACSFLIFFPKESEAALLYFDPSATSIYRGDTVTVALRIDTDEEECINVIDAVIHYDPSIRAVDVSRGSSIVNLWLETPVIDETNHTIRFAGGITNGYCGRIPGDPSLTNVLLELVFRSPGFTIGGSDEPLVRVWLDDVTQVLQNDGFATPAPLRLQDAQITLLPNAGNTQSDTWRTEIQNDTEAPSDFTIELSRNETAFDGKYFIVWNAADKQSGMSHFEVMEEPLSEFATFRWGRADAPWIKTESPYVLIDQSLNSTIRVRAIDKAGNVKIAVLVPEVAMRSLSQDRIITGIVIGAFLIFCIGLLVFGIVRRRNRILKEIDNGI